MLLLVAAAVLALLRRAELKWLWHDLQKRKNALNKITERSIELPQSPLTKVAFKDALQSQSLAKEVEIYSKSELSSWLSGNGVNIGVQTLAIVEQGEKVAMVFEFSKDGTCLLEAGRAVLPLHGDSGKLLPMLQDADTGRILELAEAQSLVLGRLAQVSSLIVSAAHIIAGMDVVRKLGGMDCKLDKLVRGCWHDQVAKFERIYVGREKLRGVTRRHPRQQRRPAHGEVSANLRLRRSCRLLPGSSR